MKSSVLRHAIVESTDYTASVEEAMVLRRLQAEFNRLNVEHFQGRHADPRIEFSKRKTYGGYYVKSRHAIILSWQAYREHGWDETLNTFRHEVAHIEQPNHKRAFWELAFRLGVTKKYASPPKQIRTFTYVCISCGGRLLRKRRFRSNVSCAHCDQRYNPKYRLFLIPDGTEPNRIA